MNTSDQKDFFSHGFTHGGIFHADDIFSTAFLRILNPDIKIGRGNVVPQHYEGIVYDIGYGQFDHHQKNSRIRGNGVPYAAFGLLWEQFGTRLLCEEDAKSFDREFIQPLDQADNTGEKNMLSQIIADWNPAWQADVQEEAQEEVFEKAVLFAEEILKRRIAQIRAERDAFDIVSRQADACRNGILCLERAMPWKAAVRNREILYVIYPSVRGGYNVQAVPSQQDETRLKLPFPESWRGMDAAGLAALTGVKDLTFCHQTGFLCATETLAGALQTAELAMKN